MCGSFDYVAPEVFHCRGYGLQVDMWSAGVVMYIILCGFPPDMSLLRSSPQSLQLDTLWWNVVSTSAKDLVAEMLQIDPADRITSEAALSNMWIIDENC